MAKCAIVTGASRGIGRETAIRLAEDGFSVALICKANEKKAEAAAAEITAAGGKAIVLCCDVKDSRQVEKTIETVEKTLGETAVLVNNAGIAQQKLFTDITDADWREMMDTDLSGVFYFCRAVLPYMIRRKCGRIINLASMWGETGGSCEVHYSAAKAGVIGLSKALAKEVAPSGITVNCVSPGVVETEMVTGLGRETMQMLTEEIPLGRLGTPRDVAAAISFLAGKGGAYVTGQVFSVNGGLVI